MITHALGYQSRVITHALGYQPRVITHAFPEASIWYDPQDLTTLFQDAAGTLPVYRPGTGLVDPPVGLMMDKSGGGYHASQTTTAARPTLSGRHNLLTATETLSTQSVTTRATSYTLSFSGTGSVTLRGTATGTYSAGTRTITCTAGTLTCTVAGSVTKADLRVKRDDSKLPAYQAVVDANTYDTVGFPLYLKFDKVDDRISCQVPDGGITGTLSLATTRGTTSYGVSIPEGGWTLGSVYNPLGDVLSILLFDRALNDAEKALLKLFGIDKGGTNFGVETSFLQAYRGWSHLVYFPLIDTSNGENFNNAWRDCSGMTSFPLLDVSSGTNFIGAWYGCSGLKSFPLLNVSKGTSFSYAWYGCSGLTSFPLLNVSSGTDFSGAWRGCSGLTSFPLLDVSSGTSFHGAWRGCSGMTSFPLLNVSSGTDFSYAWNDCSGLKSFPLLNVSKGTSFSYAWSGCSGLTSFPANFFDNCLATTFIDAFRNTKLSQESIDGILVSINSNGTSNGTFNQSGGSAPSIVGQAAITSMRSRGWTITVTGGF